MCHNVNSHVFFFFLQNKSFSTFSERVALFVTVLSLTGQNKLNFTIIMYNSPSDLEKSENTYHRIRPGVFGGEVSPEKGIYGSVIFF